jgi:phage-related minor tail protein
MGICDIVQIKEVLIGFQFTEEVFEDTANAIIDMLKVMGGDLQKTANIFGKALDAPVEGLSALSILGIVFTNRQKETVKLLEERGDHIGAQRVILSEARVAFAGA